jgi:hypothetical protein
MIKTIRTIILFPFLFFYLSMTFAETVNDEKKALQIVTKAKSIDRGWKDQKASLEMILKNKNGETSIRKMRIKTIEKEKDGDKSLTIFDFPIDVKGTAFLSFSHTTKNDDQWLYLPALKRVKRISSRNKSGSFMGSEFSFEDLTSFEIEKYTYRYLKEEKFKKRMCWVIVQFPKDRYSGYSKRIAWIDQSEYRLQKMVYYDRKSTLLKTLTFSQYHHYLNRYWRAGIMNMINHQSGKSTQLKYTTYHLKQGLKESELTKNALKRAR